jgi:hypothetical protein
MRYTVWPLEALLVIVGEIGVLAHQAFGRIQGPMQLDAEYFGRHAGRTPAKHHGGNHQATLVTTHDTAPLHPGKPTLASRRVRWQGRKYCV